MRLSNIARNNKETILSVTLVSLIFVFGVFGYFYANRNTENTKNNNFTFISELEEYEIIDKSENIPVIVHFYEQFKLDPSAATYSVPGTKERASPSTLTFTYKDINTLTTLE